MPEVLDGPCAPWPLDPSCCEELSGAEDQVAAVDIATDVLWRLTGGRYGLCEELIRPCRADCATHASPSSYGYGAGGLLRPVLDAGVWSNRPSCGCGPSGCSCRPLCVINLPGPVHAVLEVKQDGVVVPPAAWTVQRTPTGGQLVRTDGACWPRCQDLTAADDQPDTLSVRYERGLDVPAAGRRAVAQLACEVLKQCRGAKCALPAGTTNVTRDGVTYQVTPPEGWAATLRAHLPQVWAWVELINPSGARQPAAVFSLDLPPAPPAVRMSPEAPTP